MSNPKLFSTVTVGVEIHAANGYLIDQFINSSSNVRTDEYGGSIENRARFALEVIDAVVEAVGAKNVAIRLSPWSEFLDVRDATPVATWSYITQKLQQIHPDLAYIHFIEARMSGLSDVDVEPEESLNPFRDIWKGPFINCGGYNRNKAIQTCEQRENSLVAFGRVFIANPDLVERLRHDLPMNKYNRPTFYTQGTDGYIDYPFYSDTEAY
ncbi:putative 12-oxophytodienoate reductase 5 isoform X2 [Bradysia coprophila]|uniref:putative 12-oxophytodienoate reductase 5 isoform X2 n=1 Tax=Bradysia coprophila TaxID=38358 RepID=UPI00187DCF30|nr:putative 12-oxophytodienoate reductase 5 isoform X2 [Bradysia coprophila]